MKRWVYWILLLALFVNGCIEPPAPNPTVPNPPVTNSTVIGRPTRSATREVKLELLGHIGGPSMSVAVQGDYAFVGLSLELVVLDITDRTEPQWVASLALPANEVVVTGPYAYVAGRDGFTIVDIREPTQPTVVGNVALSATASTLALGLLIFALTVL